MLTWTFVSGIVQVFCKKRVLKNFQKFTSKLLCPSLKFHAGGLHLYYEKKHQNWCFSVNLAKFENQIRKSVSVILDDMKHFWFVVRLNSYNYLYERNRNETHSSCYFLAVILTEIKFLPGVYGLCNHKLEMKLLRMLLFHQNKDSRSKYQNKNEFCIISPAIKTVVNRFFSRRNKLSFRVSCKYPLSQSFYNDTERS